MLEVANLAGEVIHINLGELLSSLPAERQNLYAIKRNIQDLTGIPILKQRLLIGSNVLGFRSPVNELQDAEITMVLQDYGPSSEAVYEEALQGDVPGVMGKLDNFPQGPDARYLGIYCFVFSFLDVAEKISSVEGSLGSYQ